MSDANFVLTNENYYSAEANDKYMSVSQFKSMAGTPYKEACELNGLLTFKGVIPPPTSTALLVGSFVAAYFEGTLDDFKAAHPEMYKTTGDKGLKADFVKAEEIIRRVTKDQTFMSYMSGDKQTIMTANIFGIDWKIKMDSFFKDDKIVDLKIMRDMKPIFSELAWQRVDFIHYWGYDIQGAIYQKVVEIVTGKKLPFYIACATKEAVTDMDIIEVTQPHLDKALEFVKDNIEHVLNLKNGLIEPVACGKCTYCVQNKVLQGPRKIDDIIIKPRVNANADTTGSEDVVDLFGDSEG